MNKLINTILYTLLVLGSVLIVIVHFDLEITTGYRGGLLPYKGLIFTIFTVVVGFLLFVKSALRWFTLRKMKSFSNIIFECNISKSGKRLNTFFLYIEAVYFLTFGIFFIWISPLIEWCGWVLIIAFLDTIYFYFISVQGNQAKILITPKAIAVYERQLKLVPLANMKEADVHFDQVFIHYKRDFTYQFSIGGIDASKIEDFKKEFFKILEQKNVYISDDLRNYKH